MINRKNLILLIMAVFIIMAFAPLAMSEGEAKLDLNKASVEELVQLKGIGQSYAERILEYRENNGPFIQAEDIMKIKGIGNKIYESIKHLIMVEVPSS